jgi:hypothetical protein
MTIGYDVVRVHSQDRRLSDKHFHRTIAWPEIVERFGSTPWRQSLLDGLLHALRLLKAAGCARAYIDGSFITAKEEPGDFDACWDAKGVDFDRVDERLLAFDRGRAAQKAAGAGGVYAGSGVRLRAADRGTLRARTSPAGRRARPARVCGLTAPGRFAKRFWSRVRNGPL